MHTEAELQKQVITWTVDPPAPVPSKPFLTILGVPQLQFTVSLFRLQSSD
jgi:hypothetical protein